MQRHMSTSMCRISRHSKSDFVNANSQHAKPRRYHTVSEHGEAKRADRRLWATGCDVTIAAQHVFPKWYGLGPSEIIGLFPGHATIFAEFLCF